jgi:HK97 family phage prohead protease
LLRGVTGGSVYKFASRRRFLTEVTMIERRAFDGGLLELRATATGVKGFAAVYGVRSRPIRTPSGRTFTEVIAPGTFARALARRSLVVGLLEHNPRREFARSPGTMKLSDKPRGLYFEAQLQLATDIGREVVRSVQRGIVSGCSFAFRVPKSGDTWSEENGKVLRTIQAIELRDVSLTASPAYPSTEVTLQSLEEWIEGRRSQSVQKAILELLAARKP